MILLDCQDSDGRMSTYGFLNQIPSTSVDLSFKFLIQHIKIVVTEAFRFEHKNNKKNLPRGFWDYQKPETMVQLNGLQPKNPLRGQNVYVET